MAEPARRKDPVYDDDSSGKPVTRPELHAIEGGGEGDGVPQGKLKAAEESGGGFYNPRDETGNLQKAEESAVDSDDEEDGLYNDQEKREKKKGRFHITRRQAAVGGGISGLVVAGLFGMFSVWQGPLEFIHMAQLMDRFHFLSQEDAEDGRLTKIARYIHDPSKPQNTRLGIVGVAVTKKLDAKIHKATGLTSDFNERSGRFNGYEVDRNHSKWKDKKFARIQTELANAYGLDKSAIKDVGKGKILVNPDFGSSVRHPIQTYRAQTSFSRTLLSAAGYSKKSTYAGSRVLRQRAGWTFHPIKKLDAKIQATALETGKKGVDKLKEQFRKENLSLETNGAKVPGGKPEASPQKQSDGSTKPDPKAVEIADGAADVQKQAGNLDPTDEKTSKTFSDHIGTKVAAGGTGLIGIACVIRNISANVDKEREAKVTLPMMRKASVAMGLGSQAQSGQDISTLQLGFYKDFLTKKDADGNVVSTWNQAQSIQAELGQPQSNNDLPEQAQVFNKGNPFDFFDHVPVLGTACGVLGGIAGQIFGIVTGPVNYLVSGALLEKSVDVLSGWLSGAPISPIAAGADYGNYVNYGARLSANDQFASAGGVQLDSKQELALKNTERTMDRADFSTKSIAYKLFNPNDSRTVASHFIDSQAGTLPQNVASMLHNFSSLFVSLFRSPLTLLNASTNAAASQPYDYHGVKKVGFTAEQLANVDYENPFQNACYVVGCNDKGITGILEDSSKAEKYADLAKKCFGANIENDGTVWKIDAKTSSVNMYSDDYPSSRCRDNNPEWLRIRFWMLDTATIEGYDCYQSDTASSDESCSDIGFTSSGATTQNNAVDSDGSAVSGDAADLAKKLLSSSSVTLQPNPKSSLEAAAKGQKSPAGIDKCGTQHPPVAINPKLLAFLVDLSQQDSYTITSLTTGAHSCTSNHYKGVAADFGCDINTSKADKIGTKYGISHNFESCADAIPHWHYSIGGG